MAAKGKYTKTVVDAICEAIELGMHYNRAAALAGVDESTFYDWLKNKSDFSQSVKAAEARCVNARLDRIRKAAEQGTWTADAWLLERRFPHEYGKTVQETQGEQNLNVRVTYTNKWRTGGDDGDNDA